MIIGFELLLRKAQNIELHRAFACLDLIIIFLSPSTLKNQLMARAKKVELLIKNNLSNHPTKISLVINL